MTEGDDEFSGAEELRLLADSVATLLARAGGSERARKSRGSRSGVDRVVWSEIAAAGVLSVMTRESAGGLGMGLQAGGIIAREFGRALAPEPFVPVVGLAAGLLERLAPEHEVLGEIISGETIPAIANFRTRAKSGVSKKNKTYYAERQINGAKAWVANAGGGDLHLVIASSANGSEPGLYLVEADADGITPRPAKQSDGSYLYDVTYLETPAALIASGANFPLALSGSIDDATALAASQLLGIAGEALKLTIEFLKTREQFGKPIGAFQALQHRAVDMHIAYEIAEAGISRSLALMDETKDPTIRAMQASRAKARAGETALKITREAIQLHGAVGYTDEFDIGLYLNRALVLSAYLGDAAAHRKRWLELKGA